VRQPRLEHLDPRRGEALPELDAQRLRHVVALAEQRRLVGLERVVGVLRREVADRGLALDDDELNGLTKNNPGCVIVPVYRPKNTSTRESLGCTTTSPAAATRMVRPPSAAPAATGAPGNVRARNCSLGASGSNGAD
jgi:hypothetical protein